MMIFKLKQWWLFDWWITGYSDSWILGRSPNMPFSKKKICENREMKN